MEAASSSSYFLQCAWRINIGINALAIKGSSMNVDVLPGARCSYGEGEMAVFVFGVGLGEM